MRKILLTMLVALALLGCDHDIPNGPVVEQRDLISFGDVSTRVDSADDISEFGVFIEQNLGADNADGATEWVSLLESERVYKDGGGFTYDNKRYWVDDRTFFFLGYYPYGTTVTRTETNSGVAKTTTTSTYTMNIAIPYAANSDYMIAQQSVYTGSEYAPVVTMDFKHLLSMVSFKIRKDAKYNANDTFVVTQLGLSGVSRTGTFTAVRALNSYNEEISWTTESRNIRRRNLNVGIDTTGVDVLGNNNGFMVLPQNLEEANVKLTITYTYQQDGDSEVIYNTTEIDIPANDVKKWVSGKSYMYSLTISIDNSIYISTPTVAPWGSPQSGGIIIIK